LGDLGIPPLIPGLVGDDGQLVVPELPAADLGPLQDILAQLTV
jgi:hypothetical protein